MKLKAEIELGKRTAEIPKAKNQHDVQVYGVDKRKALEEMGLRKQRAYEYEQLAKNEDIVTEYIDRQPEKGETPTRSGAFRKTAAKPKV